MLMNVEQLLECVAGETELFGESLPECLFAHNKSTYLDLGWNPGRRCGKSATNRLSYGTA
jgi:hypothetical protein